MNPLLQDLQANQAAGTPYFYRALPGMARVRGSEIMGAAGNAATHGLAVRSVYGDILHGVAGASNMIGNITAVDDLGAAPAAGGPIPGQFYLPDGSGPSSGFGGSHFWLARLLATSWTAYFSAVRLHAVFFTGAGVPVAASSVAGSVTVVPYRLESNGNITRGAAINVGGAGATEARDAEVAGRHTFYRISALDLDGAASASLFLAGEGGGLARRSP